MQDQFKRLLSPLQVGPKTIRNRVLMTAHIPGLESDGKATDGYIAYHARRARGGAGLQMSGASGFHHTGHPSSGRGLDLTRDGVVPTLRKLADAVHEHGGMFLLQMAHATATGDYGDIGQPMGAVAGGVGHSQGNAERDEPAGHRQRNLGLWAGCGYGP
jgi:2,4-dienoyl-CoA reductase-like NADH-dependent reductase (Old Yellow Enzyme family)